MGQEMTDNEAKLQQYMASSIGEIVNDLGSFAQFTIANAFNAGYQAGYSAAGSLVTNVSQILEYQRKADTTRYQRKSDGRYYSVLADGTSSPTGWDKTSFDVSEYIITQVINKHGVHLQVDQPAIYNNTHVLVKSIVEKADDKILISIQTPTETSRKLKIIDADELR